jgi:hypothetical protein
MRKNKYFTIWIAVLALVLTLASGVDATTTFYSKTALTGGTATSLDGINGLSLSDGDITFVTVGEVFYTYRLNATSGAAESSPTVIAPDTNPGTKRWILQSQSASAIPTLNQSTSGTASNLSGTPALLNGVTATTQVLGDNSTKLATTAYSDRNAQNNVASINSKSPSQAVAMTAAASGSSGITVADNANIDFGTGNFSLALWGSFPIWPNTSYQYLINKSEASNLGYSFAISDTGKLGVYLSGAGGAAGSVASLFMSTALSFTPNSYHHVIAVVTRETNAIAGKIEYYLDGYLAETRTIAAGSAGSIDNAASLAILGFNAYNVRIAGTTSSAITYNRALTAAEVLTLYQTGSVAEKHKKASQTALTSGTVKTGQEYTIDTFVAGDDFTNIGGTNVTGNVFVATGTTPTTWSNSSSLRATGATLNLPPEGIGVNTWFDASGNGLNASYPTVGATLVRPVVKPNKQGSVTAKSTSTTVTVAIADILSEVITGAPATPATYTFEAGATSDAIGRLELNGVYKWSIINTGAGTITVTSPGADHTIVGSALVAALSSAEFKTVKTTVNTFISYRTH